MHRVVDTISSGAGGQTAAAMQCELSSAALKVFCKAIHCLSKIGEDVYFEALVDKLALRTVNSARSAYACYLFQQTFFEQYRAPGLAVDDDEREDGDAPLALRCKVLGKSCLSVCRSLAHIDKRVNTCKLWLDPSESRLVFQLFCKHGIVKTHRLYFEECETLQAVFAAEDCPNVCTGPAKMFSECLENFQSGLEEMTFACTPEKFEMTNHVEVDLDTDTATLLRTKLTLEPSDFHRYEVRQPATVTFCVREFKSIVSFCEFTGEPMAAHFESAGRPVVFAVKGERYTCDYVLATLMDQGQLSSSEDQTQASTSRPPAASQASQQVSQQISQQVSQQMSQDRAPGATPAASARTPAESSTPNVAGGWSPLTPSLPSAGHDRQGTRSHMGGQLPSLQASPEEPPPAPVAAVGFLGLGAQAMEDDDQGGSARAESDDDNDGDDDDEDCVEGTPPAKRRRPMFSGSEGAQSFSRSRDDSTDRGRLLVQDTDDEGDDDDEDMSAPAAAAAVAAAASSAERQASSRKPSSSAGAMDES